MGTQARFAPVTRVTATTTQTTSEAVDVLAYKSIDAYLTVYEAAGAAPSIVVTLQTSMQNELGDKTGDDLLWVDVATFATITTANTSDVVAIASGLLRYVRWRVTFGGTTSACTFELTGVGRPG